MIPASTEQDALAGSATLPRIGWLEALLPLIRMQPMGRGKVTRWLLERMALPGRGRIAFPLADGLVLAGSQPSLDMISHIMVHRGWDEHVLSSCRDAMGTGGVFYDIGANSGYFSLAIARDMGASVRVISFEPVPDLARDIVLAARANGLNNLSVHNLALDNSEGVATLFLPTQSVHASFVTREEGASSISVPTVRLDELIAAGSVPPPTVVKLDVEGAEMRVLEGAAETLRAHLPMLCFECDENSLRFGHDPAAMIARLRALGYRRFEALHRDGRRTEIDPDGGAAIGFGDFIATA